MSLNKNEDFGMILNTEESAFAVPCTAADCSLRLEELSKTDRSYFKDEMTSRTYCEPCGNRLRYHRKKWAARGEALPLSLEEVSARHT